MVVGSDERTKMQHYDSHDAKYGRNIRKGAPDDFATFAEWDKSVFSEEGHELSKKTRELIAIGVAATTQCPHCIEAHSRAAQKAGATEAELSEAIMVAMAVMASDSYAEDIMMAMAVRDRGAMTIG